MHKLQSNILKAHLSFSSEFSAPDILVASMNSCQVRKLIIRGNLQNKGFLLTAGARARRKLTLKSMDPLLSESNFWNIWSTNVFAFIPGNTEEYMSIILSLLIWPEGLSYIFFLIISFHLSVLTSMNPLYHSFISAAS